MLAYTGPSKYKLFFKNYQKHQSAKPCIDVFTPNYFDEMLIMLNFSNQKILSQFNFHGN